MPDNRDFTVHKYRLSTYIKFLGYKPKFPVAPIFATADLQKKIHT
jgi:hypothetical protein